MADTIPCGTYQLVSRKLTDSTFTNVCLGNAVFDDVNLSKARFHNINMSGTTFDDINFSGAQITNANYEGMTIDGILVTELLKAYRQSNPSK